MVIHIMLKGNQIEGAPVRVDVDRKTSWDPNLLGLLDQLGTENQFFTLVPISDMSELAINTPCLFACVPDPGSQYVRVSIQFLTSFSVSAQSVSFKAIVTGEDGSTAPALVRDTGNQNFEVRFVPLKRIKYTIDVQLYDKSVKQSPQTVDVRASKL